MKIRDLEELIANKKAEALNKLAINEIDSAKKLRDEIKNLKEQLELQKELEEEDKSKIINNNINSNFKPLQANKDGGDSMVEYLKNAYKGVITNLMKESVDADGGYIVPKDVSVSINKLLKDRYSLKELVSVVKVSKAEGSRVHEVNVRRVPFDKIDEAGEFNELATPTFKVINYKISKYGGLLKATAELLEDSPTDIISYLKDWFVSKMEATYNNLILKKTNETLTKVEPIKSYDDIKHILNTKIRPILRNGTVILTNQTGYNWLDTLKDKNDNYILKSSITDPAVKNLEGTTKVVVVEDDLLPVEKNNKVPFYIGNFKQFMQVFDRDVYTMETSTVAGDLWTKDQLGIKARFRMDLQIIDESAVVKGELELPTLKKEK